MPAQTPNPLNFRALRAGWSIPTRGIMCAGVLALLAACSSGPRLDQAQLAARYAAQAHGNYAPPGPPSDPWGPYIQEASTRFDLPPQWIRAVMRQESGGHEYLNGGLITSSAGAMGLMQVMPETYEEMRAQNNLGADPYNPHDNIMAGTAYLREMYDLYGSPGFLAAYNAGPRRLDDYLTRHRALPDETRHYVAAIGPNLGGEQPLRVSPVQQLAMNQIPMNIPPGPRRSYPVQYASALPAGPRRYDPNVRVTATSLPEPPAPPMMTAQAQPRPQPGGFHLVPRAMADTAPLRATAPLAGSWAIQVGAYAHAPEAERAAAEARDRSPVLRVSRTFVGEVHEKHGMLYRARLTGLSREAALRGCEAQHGHSACIVLSPAAQS
jgi:hypothetical protein